MIQNGAAMTVKTSGKKSYVEKACHQKATIMNRSLSNESGILKAAHFAANKHRDQRRKGEENSPYINHPIAVAEILTSIGGITDLTTIQAALLHDTVEDTKTTAEELALQFGDEVMNLVMEVTDDKTLGKAERKRLQVEHTKHLSDSAKMIKIADKISNVTDIMTVPPKDWDDEQRLEYFTWAERVVKGCRGVNIELSTRFDELVGAAKKAISHK